MENGFSLVKPGGDLTCDGPGNAACRRQSAAARHATGGDAAECGRAGGLETCGYAHPQTARAAHEHVHTQALHGPSCFTCVSGIWCYGLRWPWLWSIYSTGLHQSRVAVLLPWGYIWTSQAEQSKCQQRQQLTSRQPVRVFILEACLSRVLRRSRPSMPFQKFIA